MQDIQLTPHFKLSEFTRSDTAKTLHIPNIPNAQQIENLRALCVNVLEPFREHAGQPVIIGSGFRCPKLNSHPEVKGASNSQHQYGEAADISAPTQDADGKELSPSLSQSLLKEWFLWAVDNLHYDQIIWEKATKDSKRHWIHISYSKSHNRQQVLRSLIKFKS